MPTTPTQKASTAAKPPTRKQLAYLRALAESTGTTFTYPHTSTHASREIRRLRGLPAQTAVQRQVDAHFDLDAENAARERNGDVPIRAEEISGYGSNATWNRNR